MDADALLDQWRQRYQRSAIVGWDFSRFAGRLDAEEPPWDFEADCLAAWTATPAASVLDLGTGGGERLASLLARVGAQDAGAAAGRVAATEGWEPNLEVARARLAPLGVRVDFHDPERHDRLPHADASLDLVMARHEAFDARDVARVLRPGGVLLTQQVDGLDTPELRDWFGGEPAFPEVRLDATAASCRDAGLDVELAQEWEGRMRVDGVATLVEFLAVVPWNAPGFDIERSGPVLLDLAARGPLELTQRRFRLHARRTAPASATT